MIFELHLDAMPQHQHQKLKMLRNTNDLCERRTIIKTCINEDETKLGKKSFPEV